MRLGVTVKIDMEQRCHFCGSQFSKLQDRCPKCGGYVGMGVRSPGEIRALIAKINRTVPVINDKETAKWYIDTMSTAKGVLAWALGEKEMDVVDAARKYTEGRNA